MKQLLYTILFIIFGVIVSTLMGFIVFENGRQPIQEIKIKISKTNNGGFLDDRLILNSVKAIEGIDSIKIVDFDILALENVLKGNPFIGHVDAFININRDLIINIKERDALLRVFLPDNNSFYIDYNGNTFPLSNSYTPRILIANGYNNISKPAINATIYDSIFTETTLPELFQLAKKISENKFLNSQISQIYVNSVGEYDLIPELGNHSISLGNIDQLDKKLRNLEAFYKNKLTIEGWEKYDIINLMYTNQIVCTKK